jgi:catalase
MSGWEKKHIVAALRFELAKVTHRYIREKVVDNLNHVDHDLAIQVAEGIGVEPPAEKATENLGRSSPALSQANQPVAGVATRRIAVLAANGVDAGQVEAVRTRMRADRAICDVLGPYEGDLVGANGEAVPVDHALATVASVLYDAVVVPGGYSSVRALAQDGYAVHFLAEAFKHGKAIGALLEGMTLLEIAGVGVRRAGPDDGTVADQGVVTNAWGPSEDFAAALIAAVAAHRHWDRDVDSVPA